MVLRMRRHGRPSRSRLIRLLLDFLLRYLHPPTAPLEARPHPRRVQRRILRQKRSPKRYLIQMLLRTRTRGHVARPWDLTGNAWYFLVEGVVMRERELGGALSVGESRESCPEF